MDNNDEENGEIFFQSNWSFNYRIGDNLFS